jgi:hypothetical protein
MRLCVGHLEYSRCVTKCVAGAKEQGDEKKRGADAHRAPHVVRFSSPLKPVGNLVGNLTESTRDVVLLYSWTVSCEKKDENSDVLKACVNANSFA